MMKITRVGSLDDGMTLQLDGRVTGPWVELLRKSAELVLETGMALTLDLENIYYLDCEGVGLIKSLTDCGAQLENVPPFVAEQIRKCEA